MTSQTEELLRRQVSELLVKNYESTRNTNFDNSKFPNHLCKDVQRLRIKFYHFLNVLWIYILKEKLLKRTVHHRRSIFPVLNRYEPGVSNFEKLSFFVERDKYPQRYEAEKWHKK